jgi:putative transposase
MELTKTLIVEYEKNELMERLLEDFRDMVNFCIDKGLKYGYSLKKLHQICYEEFKKKYDYNTNIYPQAYRIAQSIIRSWKERKIIEEI